MSRDLQIKEIRSKLPARVSVQVESTDEGLWAKISSPDGKLANCYTQASNAAELVVMVNDAIFTHYEIAEDVRKDIGYYVPVSHNHLRMEELFNSLVSMEKQLGFSGSREETLTLQEAIC